MTPPADSIPVLTEIVCWSAGAAALLFIVTTVLAAKEANTGSMWGRPRVLAEAAERIFPAVFAFSIALAAGDLGAHVRDQIAPGAASGGAVLDLWAALAAAVVQVCLTTVSVEMAIAVLTGALEGQLAQVLGQPHAVARGWTRMVVALLAGGLALLSPRIAEAILWAAAR